VILIASLGCCRTDGGSLYPSDKVKVLVHRVANDPKSKLKGLSLLTTCHGVITVFGLTGGVLCNRHISRIRR
jgi:hypothetical protein